jgi:hypothetical protein
MWRNQGVFPCILNPGNGYRLMVSSVHLLFYPIGKISGIEIFAVLNRPAHSLVTIPAELSQLVMFVK